MQNYNCKNCGAELYWDTKAGCLKCQFCDAEYQPTDFEDNTVAEQETVQPETVEKEYANVGEIADDMSVYACKNCGGEVVTLNTTMATICPYCGEAISITSKSAGNFRPEMCIPFAKNKKEIMEIYKNYVNKSFLTPKAFKEQNTVEKIQGLFAPFYLHSMDNRARHVFEGERVSSRRRGDDKITTHKVYQLSIDAKGSFDKIPTDASVRLQNSLMDAVEPFNYGDIKDYNPAYMAGFMAEQTDDDKEEMDMRAEARAKSGMREKAKAAFGGYTSVILKSEDNDIENHTSSYVMLPVWLLNVTHNNHKYTFAINGQTGKIVGKLPMDKLKLCLVALGTFVASDIVFTLISMLAM